MRTWRAGTVVVASILGGVLSAFAQETADRIRIVVVNDETPDGVPEDETFQFSANRDVLRIAAAGQVLFDGSLSDGQTNRAGHFLHSGGTVTPLLFRSDPAPSPYPSGNVAFLFETRLGRTGSAAGTYQLDLPGNPAILATFAGSTRATRAASGWALPGGTELYQLQPSEFAYNGTTLAFVATVGVPPSPSREGLFRIAGSGNEELLALAGSALPGLAGSEVFAIVLGPYVHENGAVAAVLTVLDEQQEAEIHLVVFPPPGGGTAPVIVASTGVTMPGVGEVSGFDAVTFGTAETPQSIPRVVYRAAGPGGRFVFDTAAGSDPVLGPTTVVDGNSPVFSAGARFLLAACDDGNVVAVGNSAGPAVTTLESDAVWRWTPGEGGGTASMDLVEGTPLVDLLGADTTLQRFLVVHVNQRGRVAAEVETPGKQAILLQDVPGGPFRMVLQQGVEYFADGRRILPLTFVNQLPTNFVGTGTGQEGLQSRFAANGEFVFTGGGSQGTPRGIFVLGNDAPEGCDVKAVVKGRDLVVTGGDCGARLVLRVSLEGEYFLRPGTGTTVNGFEGEVTMNASGSLRVSMGAGNDDLRIESAFGGIPYGNVGGDIVVDAGGGDDHVTLLYVESAGSLQVSMGRAAGGKEWLTLERVDVGRDLRVTTGPTEVDALFDGIAVLGRTFVAHSGAKSAFSAKACGFQGKAKFTGGPGFDDFEFDECRLFDDLFVDLKEGILGNVLLSDCEGEGADVRIEGRRSGSTSYTLEDCFLLGGSARVTSGTLGSGILFDGTTLSGDADIRTSGTGTGSDVVNEVSFGNSFADRRVKVKGKGSHQVHVGSDAHALAGVDVRLKGGIFDTVSITNTLLVHSGGVRVQSNASGGVRYIVDGIEVQSGAVDLRGTGANDFVTVQHAELLGGVKAKMGAGDDRLQFFQVICDLPVSLDGGPGTDALEFSGDQLFGGLRHRNHEVANVPEVLPPFE